MKKKAYREKYYGKKEDVNVVKIDIENYFTFKVDDIEEAKEIEQPKKRRRKKIDD